MKNVIRVTILAALTVTAALSKTTVNDQPPPCCYPCVVAPAPADQPPPCCYPCVVE
jgi:hypothetical protein